MKKKTKTTKKRKQTDSTLRNVRAAKKRMDYLEKKISILEIELQQYCRGLALLAERLVK